MVNNHRKDYVIDSEISYNEFKAYLKEDSPEFQISGNFITTPDYRIEVQEQYKALLDEIKPSKSTLIYGKDTTEKVTTVEIKDDQLWVFKAGEDPEIRELKLWITCSRKPSNKWTLLSGRQEYKYVRYFDTVEEFQKAKGILRKKRYDYFTINNLAENQMIYYGITIFHELKVKDVSRLGFDIEADGLVEHKDSEIYTISNTFRTKTGEIKKTFREDEFENQGEMIDAWTNWVREIDPEVMVAHNGFGYDFRYLTHVAELNGTKLYLGRDGSEANFPKYTKKVRVDGTQEWEYTNCLIFGRSIVDTMFLAVKYDIGRNFPSWGLKPIIEYLGMVEDGRQFYDASKIREGWKDPVEREKIVKYCEDDGDDCLNLYELMVPSFFYMCQSIPKPFQVMLQGASGSWLNAIMLRGYFQDGKSLPKTSERKSFGGGISFGIPGVHRNVFKIDIASMYPSIMRQWRVADKKKDPENKFFELVDTFTEERFKNKRLYQETGDKYYDDMQASQKVFINSCYGMMGTSGLSFNSFNNAAFVTGMGRQIIRKTIQWATGKDLPEWWCGDREYDHEADEPFENVMELEFNSHDFVMVNADTDSISFKKKDESEFSEQELKDLIAEFNKVLPDLIVYEDDGYFEKIVVVKAKNYVLKEHGQDKIKYKGSSFKDAKKEPALREFMQKILEDSLIHETTDYVKTYEKYIQEALDIKDIKRWAVKKSITEKLYSSERANETKVLDAIGDKPVRIGDKVFLFNKIEGMKQKVEKGEKVFLKSGEPKMVENKILKMVEDFDEDYDKWHYVERVWKTINILKNVIDMEKITKYHLKSNRKLLEE
jgi:DNA polymerase elongation subunit (family B)